MSTRSRSHWDVPEPPPVDGPTDSPRSAYDPWTHDYGPRDPDPPVPTGQAFREARTARQSESRPRSSNRPSADGRGGRPGFAERMRLAGIDPALADRYEKPLPDGTGLRGKDD